MASLSHTETGAIAPTTVSAGGFTVVTPDKPAISMKGIIHTSGMMLSFLTN
jgi:hypothetical protein